MALSVGQVLKGHNGVYNILEALQIPTVFKACVLTTNSLASVPSPQPPYVVIKTEPVGSRKVIYMRERLMHLHAPISSSPYVRELVDLIGSNEGDGTTSPGLDCLVLKWMETSLANVKGELFRSHAILPKIVAKLVLEALAVLHAEGLVHTDVNPNNILLSGHRGSAPEVKLGDLRNVVDQGYASMQLQSLETRAPEVWSGAGCFSASDVWSLGVTLAHWLAGKALFGISNKPFNGMTEAWCIAKIIRLIGPLNIDVRRDRLEEFATAQALEGRMEFPKLGSLRQELESLPGQRIDEETIDFIESLLVVNHMSRPSVSMALEHPWIKSVL